MENQPIPPSSVTPNPQPVPNVEPVAAVPASPAPPVQPESVVAPRRKSSLFLYLVIFLISAVVFGTIGYFLGQLNRQVAETPMLTNDANTESSESDSTAASNQAALCTTTYSSQFLKLSFPYDSCEWEIREELVQPEDGVFSRMWARNKTSGQEITIKAETMGMGGGYPGCFPTQNALVLRNDLIRFQLQSTNFYHYLTPKNDYALKGQSGPFGDEKFQEYVALLNPDPTENVNLCWRGSGMNPVEMREPMIGAESWQNNKDIVATIEDPTVSMEFLQAADGFMLSLFGSLK